MEQIYVCGVNDTNDIVSLIQKNTTIYGIDTVSTGIMDSHIDNVTKTLNGEVATSRVVGRRVDGQLMGFAVMYNWITLPNWSIPIAYSASDMMTPRKISRSYNDIIVHMIELAEIDNRFDFYYVHRLSNRSRNEYGNEKLLIKSSIADRYNIFYDEIIQPYSSSQYPAFQAMMNMVAGKNVYTLAVSHLSCKPEYRRTAK